MVLSSIPANKEIYNEISIIIVLIIAVKTEAGESKVQIDRRRSGRIKCSGGQIP